MLRPRTLVASFFAVLGLGLASGVPACATGLIADIDSGTDPDGGGPLDAGACTSKCNGACADLKTDNANCGKCGTACAMGATCIQGSCQCGTTDSGVAQTKCGTACVDTKNDNTNCGKCGTICGNDAGAILGGGTWTCANGTCSIVCPMGKTECSGACVDTKVDNENCGSCANACAAMTEQCMQGLCCKSNETICTNLDGGVPACTDVKSDKNNCGMCGKTCSGMTPNCANGTCTAFLVIGVLGGHTYYKVPINGVASDVNTKAACVGAGLKVGCTGPANCSYNDAQCVPSGELECGNPMKYLSQAVCGTLPSSCAALNGVYQNMGGA
jgi:hypothetical protein